jgi:hypothetical protein
MYTIYHVVGVKVGCSKNFEKRDIQNKERYGEDIKVEVLDTYPDEVGDQFAGDREWEWADTLGYPRKNHYTQRWDTMLTTEELVEAGRMGGSHFLPHKSDPDLREKHGIGFENNPSYNKSDKHKADAAKGAAIAAANGTLGTQTQSTCPHCGKVGQTSVMGRWHFDNCKKNPNRPQDKPKDPLFTL